MAKKENKKRLKKERKKEQKRKGQNSSWEMPSYGYYLLLAIITLVLYGNSSLNDYALDDYIVTDNINVNKGLEGLSGIFTSHYITDKTGSYAYRPITLLSYSIEYMIFGKNVTISHIINILLYLATICMIFYLFKMLLPKYPPFFPWMIAFLFCIHPIHSEVVNNLKSRDELLSFLFALSAMYFAFKLAFTKKLPYIFLILIFGLLSYYSKKSSLPFLVIVPLAIYYFIDRKNEGQVIDSGEIQLTKSNYTFWLAISVSMFFIIKKVGGAFNIPFIGYLIVPLTIVFGILCFKELKSSDTNKKSQAYTYSLWIVGGLVSSMLLLLPMKIGVFVLFLLGLWLLVFRGTNPLYISSFYLVILWFGKRVPGLSRSANEKYFKEGAESRIIDYYENPLYFTNDIGTITATSFNVLLEYLQILVFPYPLLLYYGYPQIPIKEWDSKWPFISLFIHIALLIWALKGIKEKKLYSFGILFYFLGISMFSNLLVPAPGMFAERFAYMPSLGFCILVAALLWKYLKPDFANNRLKLNSKLTVILLLLFAAAASIIIPRNTNWYDVETLLGHDIDYLPESTRINHLYAQILLKPSYKTKKRDPKRVAKAEKYLKKSVELYPEYAAAWNNLGYVYLFGQRWNEAIPCFLEGAKHQEKYIEAYANTAFCFNKLGKADSAIRYFEKVVLISGDGQERLVVNALKNLKNLYESAGISEKYKETILKAIEAFPDAISFHDYIAREEFLDGDYEAAFNWWEEILAVQPQNDIVMYKIMNAYLELGDTLKANEYKTRIVEINGEIDKQK